MTKRQQIRSTQKSRESAAPGRPTVAYEGGEAPAAAPETIAEEGEAKPEAAAPAVEQAV